MELEELKEKLDSISPELAFVEKEIQKRKKEIKDLEARKEELLNEVTESFENEQIGNYENDILKLSYTKPSVRTGLDKERLEQDYPEIAKKYIKETAVKGSIRIKIKGE